MLQAYPDQMQPLFLAPHNLHRSQIHRNGPCPVSTNQSPAGWLTPLPSSCFEAAHNHSSQGRWVMWSGGFRVTSSHSSSAATRHPSWPQPPCLYSKQWLPHLAQEPLPSSAHPHSLCCPRSTQCRKAAPGTTRTQRRAGEEGRQGWWQGPDTCPQRHLSFTRECVVQMHQGPQYP